MTAFFHRRGPRSAALSLPRLLPLLLFCAHAHAARPMVVDDASITAPGNCQLEAWTTRASAQTEYWTMPACNVGGNWELSAGLGRIGPDGIDGAYRAGIVQAKTIFHPLETNGWGIGLTVANQFRQGSGIAGNLSVLVPVSLSVLVPVSLSLLDDRVLLHANAGWLRAHANGSSDLFLAGGGEWAVMDRLSLTLEAYGTRHGHAVTQAGLRYALVPDRVSLDAGIGRRIGGADGERYGTLGLTFAGPVLR